MHFRNATLSDLKEIIDIYNSTIPSRMVTADTEPVTVESRISWFEKHVPGPRPLWMVMNDNKVCGWVALHSFYGRPAYDHTAEISIYLRESERGQGLGRKTLQEAIAESKKIGIKTLLGYIFEHNVPSRRLFNSSGFDDWGKLTNVALLDGIERSLIIVGSRISK